MEQPLLSIGMIVKNEIRCIEKCLRALQPLREAIPCQLVIADTGSDDGTREVAARYADTFFDLPWENDFSAARNAVLDRCVGQWYLSVDADEYLDDAFGQLADFLTDDPQAETAEFALITVRNFTDQSLDKDTAASFLGVRMARLRPGLRYQGKIHEHFPVHSDSQVALLGGVVLWHDGYAYASLEQRRNKARRNMALLRAELAETPEDPLLLVQCVESCDDPEEKLGYIRRGLEAIRAGAPGWEYQGASLLRYALRLAVAMGLSEAEEWAHLALQRFSQTAVVQIDVNAILCDYYRKRFQWKQVLQYADAYWEAIQRLDRGEFPVKEFALIYLTSDTQARREVLALYQAEACHRRGVDVLALRVLQMIPLETITPQNLGGLVDLLAQMDEKTNVDSLFLPAARRILLEEPDTQVEWRRREALRAALDGLLQDQDPQTPCPYGLIEKLEDPVYAPAAAILESVSPEEAAREAGRIPDWRRVPLPVLKKLAELDLAMPVQALDSMDFEGICRISAYLPKELEQPVEQILSLTEQLPDGHPAAPVWRFQLLSGLCAWFQWKNQAQAERLYAAFCAAARSYLAVAYPAESLQPERMAASLPQNCRLGAACVRAEEQTEAGDLHGCVETLREMLDLAPGLKGMVRFLTGRLEEIGLQVQIASNLSPELVAMAKQIRDMLSRCPADDPQVFLLKSSDAYQKMKFLIEDPILDSL